MILQARILSRLACLPPGDLSDSGMKLQSLKSPALADGFLATNTTWEALFAPKRSVEVPVSSTYEDDLI